MAKVDQTRQMKFSKHHNFHNILKLPIFSHSGCWRMIYSSSKQNLRHGSFLTLFCKICFLYNYSLSPMCCFYRAANCLSWLDKHSKHRSCNFCHAVYEKPPECTVTPHITTTKHTTHIITLISCWTNVSNYFALSIKSILTLILLTWTKWWSPASASKWRMGFNSAFKGLISSMMSLLHKTKLQHFLDRSLVLCAANIFINSAHQIRFP
jgi:hypothetical protein